MKKSHIFKRYGFFSLLKLYLAIMITRPLFIIIIFAAIIFTVILYEPASIAIFKITEPYYACPVKSESGKLVIRNDSRGDGDFGAKRRNGRMHSGIDIQAPIGTPVRASKSGLAFCGNVPTGYGKYVMIYHPDSSQTFYGHLMNWGISSPQKVRRGDVIGFVGKTGNAGGKQIQPHLHFEIRKDGEPQDPLRLMK